MEARIGLCKCREAHKTYGVRFEKITGGWQGTWAFEINEAAARRERYGEDELTGNITFSEEYPGCPYCGTKGFAICSCGKLNCNNYYNGIFECEWCGSRGILGNYDGSGFKAGGDA